MKKAEQYESEILKVIEENKIYVIKDIFAFYTGIKSSQFYNLKLEKSESILKALDDNKVKTKYSLKQKWLDSNNAILQLALYKLICTDDERRALSMQQIEHSGNLKNINIEVSSEKGAKALKEYLDETETD